MGYQLAILSRQATWPSQCGGGALSNTQLLSIFNQQWFMASNLAFRVEVVGVV